MGAIFMFLCRALGFLGCPFSHGIRFLKSIRNKKYKNVVWVQAGICVAAPVAIILSILLATADRVFESVLDTVITEFLDVYKRQGVATVVTCCTLPVGAGATVAAELNGYLESYGYLDHMVGILDPMVGRLPLLVICVIYCSFFATKFAPDEPIVKSITEVKQGAGRVALKPVSYTHLWLGGDQ